ncbi:MAG: PmoA family protein [Planctomycetaceae bacterium]|nr:PmoA family protein [Planctomycetaceae bacterium]
MRQGYWLVPVLMWASVAVGGEVSIVQRDASLRITIGGDIFTVFRYGDDLPKPYFLPVTAENGWDLLSKAEFGDETVAGRAAFVCEESLTVKQNGETQQLPFGTLVQVSKVDDNRVEILESDSAVPRSALAPLAGTVTRLVNLNPPQIKDRNSPLYYDHPHHKGIWLSVDEVNGIKFWNEDGRIKTHSVKVLSTGKKQASFELVAHWMGVDDKPLLRQTTIYTIYDDFFLGCDTTFSAIDQPVSFGDTKEGMFAIRLPNSMREMISQGPVRNAEGKSGSEPCWGLESPWVDYCGKVDDNTLGVTLMDHPANPRRSRYHVRNYGLFAINPFGTKSYSRGELPEQPLTLEPNGEGARFRYGLYVHAENIPDEAISKRYATFVNDLN